MTDTNSEMARSARQLQAVAGVVAALGVVMGAMILALAPRDGVAVIVLVPVAVVLLAAWMWLYAARPGIFNGAADGAFGDPLRTEYHQPSDVAVTRAEPTPAERHTAVSEHIYAWQSVRRVAPGDRVWTPAYVRLVLGQVALVMVGLAVLGGVTVAAALGLGVLDDAMAFVIAAVVLVVTFAMSHRSGVVDARDLTTAPMAPLPDLAWQPQGAAAMQVSAAQATPRQAA